MATVCILSALVTPSQAQQNSEQANEVYLSFQYRGVVGNYVTTYYKDGQFYLPVSELFSLLKVDHNVNQGSLTISGLYLGEQEYVLNFDNQTAQFGDKQIQLQADDFLIKEIDYFMKPEVFNELFGLKFTTNFNNLTLDLETTDKMPVVAQYEREQERKKLGRDQQLYDRSFYPLQYDRNYSTLDGAFLDYNLSAVYSNNSQLFTFSNSIGMEVLGGDVQGNLFGAFSGQQSSFTTSGLRWRYVQRDNDLFSSAIAGQTNTEGITSRAITGVKISNRPVEPRLLFDRFPIEGNVPAQSEVELYLNNRLVDYQEADQSGNYRFLVPLTYGSTNYSVRIYTPSGRQIERNSRIQIPFDYLPPGEVDYNISGGQLQNPILGFNDRGYMGEASISAGITNWLTAKASSEYLTQYHSTMPSFTGTLNARLFSNYLISANINSENFYRLTSSVVYGSGASWSLSYDYNPGNSQLYNVGGSKHLGRVNLFTPLQIGEVPLNIRWGSTYQKRGASPLFRYRADLSTRLGRLNVRLGYLDQQVGELNFITTTASRITNSYTYSIGRFQDIPSLLRGMFIRGQLSYLPGLKRLEEVEFQLSRDLMQTGRVQLSYGHNFLGGFNSLSLNVTVDFNKIRSNTTSRTTGSELSISQNLRGSIGYDPYGNQLLLNNRQQVGQSGAAVRLFVDNNNDGAYQDSTDDVITDPAVRLNRSGGRNSVKNGINYISQLLPYYRYDIEINKGALSNPLLVPDVENFSIVTDPNQYKTIEVPFYLSGVISGKVEQKQDSTLKGLGGVRLYLESNYEHSSKREAFTKELRTFSDGSFYTYEVPPGKYYLYIDPNQLEFLESISRPDTMDIEVEAIAQGDFIEDLNFTVSAIEDTIQEKKSSKKDIASKTSDKKKGDKKQKVSNKFSYKIQLASFQTRRKAESYAKEAAQNLGGSFIVVRNTSNGLYAIRSLPITHRNQAVETIISYHNSRYKSAALVVMKNNSKKPKRVRSKFIQIGAYNFKERAERFAASSAKKLNQETAVTYHKDLEMYLVYINKKYSSSKDREARLASIRSLYSYGKAYINRRNRIQIGAFSSQKEAKTFAEQSGLILNEKVEVYYDSLDYHSYNVQLTQQFSSNAERYNTLNNIRNRTSPFHDAFVSTISYEDTTMTEQPTGDRSMKFTYQIEITGVTEESEQAFVSSWTNQNSDTKLSRPKEDTIIFENVSTWNETQNLQRKLSKISTIGHPIVILIEEN